MNDPDIIDALDNVWNFTDKRVYMLVAIARSKENDSVAATSQPTMRKVVEHRDELRDKLEQLRHATSRSEQRYRLYATVNGRNARDALHFLQKEALHAVRKREKSGETPRLLKRVDHEWKSILHQPRCRDEQRFLWDIDDTSPQARSSIRNSLTQHTEVSMTAETPNGWHIVTAPFNFTEVGEYDEANDTFYGFECERKTDDMMFLDFLD